MGAIIIVLLIVFLCCANLFGQAAATSNLKRENKESMQRAKTNYENWAKSTAQKNDFYYNPACKSFDTSFYSDGSLRLDHTTKKTYSKGEYMCDSQGNNCRWEKVGPDVKRPPGK